MSRTHALLLKPTRLTNVCRADRAPLKHTRSAKADDEDPDVELDEDIAKMAQAESHRAISNALHTMFEASGAHDGQDHWTMTYVNVGIVELKGYPYKNAPSAYQRMLPLRTTLQLLRDGVIQMRACATEERVEANEGWVTFTGAFDTTSRHATNQRTSTARPKKARSSGSSSTAGTKRSGSMAGSISGGSSASDTSGLMALSRALTESRARTQAERQASMSSSSGSSSTAHRGADVPSTYKKRRIAPSSDEEDECRLRCSASGRTPH